MKLGRRSIISGFVGLLGFAVITFQNCSPAAFFVRTSQTPQTDGGGATIAVHNLKPTLAVRGINCMLCHAQVNSNVISDFGVGDPQFFVGQQGITPGLAMTLPWYGNYYGTWQLANQINGTVFVPKSTVTDSAFLTSINQSAPISLAGLMNLDLGPNYYGGAPNSGTGSMASIVSPAAGSPAVQETTQLYIGAPTVSQLLALTKTLPNPIKPWEPIGTGSSIAGIVVQNGTGGTYITNPVAAGTVGSTITCHGDIVIQGTVFLNNVTVNTDGNGCRIMATGSVFIQGPVSYTSTSSTQNLQISSASAILMGFDVSSLTFRLAEWYPDSQPLFRRSQNNGPTNTQINNGVVAEAQVIGALLEDPGYVKEGSYSHPPNLNPPASACPTGSMITYQANNGGVISTDTECKIAFSRILLNAPNIQSRYVGTFSGVAIAEIALFAPGALQFSYDATFSTVPILPLLGSSVLSASY
jgi:hypothetical protein